MSTMLQSHGTVELKNHEVVDLDTLGKVLRALGRLKAMCPNAAMELIRACRFNHAVKEENFLLLFRNDLVMVNRRPPAIVQKIVLAATSIYTHETKLEDPRLNPGPSRLV